MRTMIPILETKAGRLFEADCNKFLSAVESESVDLAFADPPFNLGKQYASQINDNVSDSDYIAWCKSWVDELVRVTKPGGSIFLWNIPKWNLSIGGYITEKMAEKVSFRHWITVDIKYSLPIRSRLYPAHYSLLYFTKGKRAAIFHPDRLPVPCCRHCGGELKDYGGYKDKMNPQGVSCSDVWTDIPPVRHAKYKKRDANALALKLMDRIVSMASDPGSLILDPFGGSGTTFVAAELTGRRWIGADLHCADILDRFNDLESDRIHIEEIHKNKNVLFTEADLKRQRKAGKVLSKNYRIAHEMPNCTCQRSQTDLFETTTS
jgi:site-specific DNA-methyltransferase (adenine-specific)